MIGLLRSPTLLIAIFCALAGAGCFAYVTHLKNANSTLSVNLAAERGKYTQCLAALRSAGEDRRRDDTIDRIPDAGLRDAAREWLLTPGRDPAAAPRRP
jgi:hypothetical protein